jgi:hypothetical protein
MTQLTNSMNGLDERIPAVIPASGREDCTPAATPGSSHRFAASFMKAHQLSQCMSLMILFEILPPVVEP